MPKSKALRVTVGIVCPMLFVAVLVWAVFVKQPMPCLIRMTTGLYCPACGATRAVIALVNGDLRGAAGYNIFVTAAIVPLLIFACSSYVCFVFNIRPKLSERALICAVAALCIFCVLFFVFGAVRNIPIYPFTLLAP